MVFPGAVPSAANDVASALSFVMDRTGRVVAQAESSDETIVYANVPIQPLAACGATAPTGSDTGAD